MALLSDYTAGTVTAAAGGTAITGTGTAWQTAGFQEGDIFIAPGWCSIIQSVNSNTSITLYPVGIRGAALSGAAYRLRYMSDGSRVSAQARALIDLLGGSGSLEALAEVTGLPNTIPMFTGPGEFTLVTKQDLTSGANYDVQVDELADRAAYDGQVAGFAVLVSNVGDGRSAIYSKNSSTSGDWSDPAYVTGAQGEQGEQGEQGPPGIDGLRWKGAWATSTAYSVNDGVSRSGTSYICKTAHTSGSSSAPGTGASWATYWDVLAQKGVDGTGTGDVTGPAAATDGHVALFSGATGKVLRSAGVGVQTTALDATANLLMRTGAFGLGTNDFHPVISAADLDDFTKAVTSFRYVENPNGLPAGFYEADILRAISTVAVQRLTALSGAARGSVYERTIGNTFTDPWQKTYNQRNILGTVSQSSGVPTGAIVEQGANANGKYTRFADGTQICWHEINVTTVSGGNGNSTWTFPSTFASGTAIVMTDASTGLPSRFNTSSGGGASTSSASIYGSDNVAGGITLPIKVFAIGRWY